LNINVRGSELRGSLHDGIKINLRTGNRVTVHESCVQNEGDMAHFGGLAVLTKNPTGIKVHEINEKFIQYLLRKFRKGCLTFFANSNKQQACVFCRHFSIEEPFGSSCCVLTLVQQGTFLHISCWLIGCRLSSPSIVRFAVSKLFCSSFAK